MAATGYVGRHGPYGRVARATVFCTLQGGRVDPSYVRHLLPRLAIKAGISRCVHAHGLRYTYASELAREHTPINVIRDVLGHSTLAVTDRYLRDVAPMHVIGTMRARAWGGVSQLASRSRASGTLGRLVRGLSE